MNPLTAAALRRLTGEGAFYSSSRYGSGNCGNSLMSSSLLSSASSSRHVSMMSTLDGHCTQGPDSLNYILEMTGMHMANSKSSPNKPRRYQGYCSPESPTTLAKEIYSTPPSNSGDGSGNRRVFSPMSVDGSDMCGPSRRCTSHSYEVYQNALGSSQGSWPGDIRTNTSAIALSPTSSTSVAELMNVHPHAKTLQWKDRQSSGSLSLPPTSPTSPPRITSPRTAMLKDMYNKQAFQTLSSHEPSQLSPLFHRFNGWISPLNGYTTLPSVSSVSNGWSSSSTDSNCPLTAAVYGGLPAPISFDDQQTPRSLKAPQPLSSPARPNNPTPDSKPPPFSPNETLFSSSPPSDPRFRTSTPPPSIFIADGLETAIHSPLSSSGTLLSYTSNRGVDSGLLAVKPLSEVQVAEYRFWRPCGRGRCTFGCGESREGERRAAGRLFRGVSAVEEDLEHGEGDGGDFEAEEGGEEGYGREERFGRFEYEGRE
ncbi:hypothetical protein GQ43DRAFT_210621 [Delitschia confertaspora ATCC 74209]|uniref:Uncharacterized protein n=1 Tax=Delitschia confertaspora ATCC 74209 TaxID=1513339 RepID=A0A9P4JV16_9PLEO|nr:hypothetical protein GQ43DRAFT_210621 [Delitschia confertaspora ATCC 74209]